MSGDTTIQMLKRLTWLPDREANNNGTLIGGQEYTDVEFVGGTINNVTLTDVTINGETITPTLRIVTTAGDVTPASDDYTIVINKTVPESTAVLLSTAQTSGRRLEIKDGAGNAASYNITLTGTVDGDTNPTINADYGSRILEYNGTQWNILASADSSEGVVGPGTATDNAIARFDGITGSVIQNSTVTVSDAGVVTGSSIDTASSANILKVNGTSLTAVTGTGAVVLATSPTLVTPALGTPASGVATNLTGTATALNIGGNAATASAVAVGGITGLGTGVATALAVNVGTAGSPVVNGGALGTPSSGVATNLTGTATAMNIGGNAATATTASTASAVAVGGITGLGTGVATALAVNVGSAGAPVVFNGAGGTPLSMTATNLSGTAASLTAGNVTTNANLTGAITSVGNATSLGSFTSAQLATAVTNETGSGALMFATSPTITTSLIWNGTSSGTTTVQAAAAAGSTTLTLPAATDTLIGKATTDTLTNKTFDTAGTGNSFSINGVATTANTGTGAVARAASPTFTGTTNTAALITTVADASNSAIFAGATNLIRVVPSAGGMTVDATTANQGAYAPLVLNGSTVTLQTGASINAIVIDANGIPKYSSISRVTSDVPVTSSTALTNITGLTATLISGRTYLIIAHLYTTSASAGGLKIDSNGGTATATSFIADGVAVDISVALQSRGSALNSTLINTTGTAQTSFDITATMTVSSGGTFIPRFAQNTSNGTSTVVKAGSWMQVSEIP